MKHVPKAPRFAANEDCDTTCERPRWSAQETFREAAGKPATRPAATSPARPVCPNVCACALRNGSVPDPSSTGRMNNITFALPAGLIAMPAPLFAAEPPPVSIVPPPDLRPNKDALFRELVREYGGSLYFFVLKRVGHADDAADIAQQAFVEAACSLTTFRGEAELSTWIFGIAVNLTRNYVVRAPHRRHRFENDEVLESCESPDLDPAEQLSQRQGLRLVSEAMEKLPPEMSAALGLVVIDELSYEQAAAELAVPVGTVRSRVSRARAAVREHLRAAGYDTAPN